MQEPQAVAVELAPVPVQVQVQVQARTLPVFERRQALQELPRQGPLRQPARRAPHAARFLHPEGHDYFAMLREKLHWSETPERLRGS